MRLPPLSLRRGLIVTVAVAALVVGYLTQTLLLRWTLRRWLASNPIAHVSLTLKELGNDRGVLEVHPEGSPPFLVPFGLTYTIFSPNVSLTVSQTWPELDLGPLIAFNVHADIAIQVPLTGGWRAGGSIESPSVKEKASGQVFHGRTDLALSTTGGVASGNARSGKKMFEWNLTLGPPDFGTVVPFDVKGKLTYQDEATELLLDTSLVRDGDLIAVRAACRDCGHAATTAGRAKLSSLDAKAKFLTGSTVPTFSGEADMAGELVAASWPTLPVAARFVAQGDTNGVASFSLAAHSPALPWHAAVKGALNGWHEGHADFELPLAFTPELAKRPYWEANFSNWEITAGKITLTAEAAWKSGSLKAAARVYGRGVVGSRVNLPFELDALRFAAELSPRFRQLGPNTLTMKSIGDKVAAKNLSVEIGWQDARAFELKRFTAQFAGGTVTLFPFTYSTKDGGMARSKLSALKLDLAVLTPLILGPESQGRGTMTGDIPWRIEKGTFHVDDAIVHNDGPGRLSYRDATTAHLPEKVDFLDEFNAILAQGQQVLVMKALQNFDFTVLRLRMSRHGENEMTVELDLKGRNPDLAKGQPFEIVLPISGKVEPLLKETIWKSFYGGSE